MSQAIGFIKFKDGEINVFQYNGTSDCCFPKLFNY
jgi:hypothetical protein